MSSNPSSSLLLVLLVAVVVSAGVGGAVTVSPSDLPSEGQVGNRISVTFQFTELYTNFPEYDINGTTGLQSVTWSVENVDLSNNVVGERTYDGQSFDHPVSQDEGIARVHVTLAGSVPPIQNYSYAEQETVELASFAESRQGGTANALESYTIAKYTPLSRQARTEIESAQAAIQAAGGHPQAETTLQNAISAYQAQNFENAVDLANQAERTASQKQQNQQRNQLIIYAVIGLVVIGILIGAFFWWRSQQTTSRL